MLGLVLAHDSVDDSGGQVAPLLSAAVLLLPLGFLVRIHGEYDLWALAYWN